MNKSVKELWLTALRSDKYNQGSGMLKQINSGETSYCCLGVLYEIATVVGVASHGEPKALDSQAAQCRFVCPGESPEPHWLSPTMRTWSELTQEDEKRLSDMNDKENKTFAEIATFVENNL